jgi:DNA modification methylase
MRTEPVLSYEDFLRAKVKLAESYGFEVTELEVNPALKPHQAASVVWAVRGGRRGVFEAFGLGKSVIQLEIARIVIEKAGARDGVAHRFLITCPLGVVSEFQQDAVNILGWAQPPKFIRRIEEAEASGIYLTNYETVRDGKLDPAEFVGVSLDEAAILRGLGGTKTFREMMLQCTGDGGPSGRSRADGKRVEFRFVATATPSPNEYIELLAYSEFLGIMDVSQAKTRFFKRDSTKADNLTLHAHKEREFWLWVASWALFVQKPSDLGFSDEGYALPALNVVWHEIPTDHAGAGHERSGQAKMFRDASIGVQDSAAEKRRSLPDRVAKLMQLLTDEAPKQAVIWCDLNDEQQALEDALAAAGVSCSSLTGTDALEKRLELLTAWRNRETCAFLSKPSMYGAGVNLQQCAWMAFAGIGFKFHEVIQAVHRIYRFLQVNTCTVHFIYTEAERGVRKQLERKWTQHNHMVEKMTQIIREYGLSHAAMAHTLTRKLGVERVEVVGPEIDGRPAFRLVNEDCVLETRRMPDNSVGLGLTSIPFSSQYEYSPNYADFGHSEGNAEFFRQMDYLVPELFRVLMPGRIFAVHVKDRIVPGGMTGLGFQTVYPFHVDTLQCFTRHGFGYMGMKTIVTDVVRENNQTYRLGWTEQCKDGTKMGVGMPEYLLLFRKPPTDRSNSYADVPVVKQKSAYTRSRWQVDAHGFTRFSGNRVLTPEEIKDLPHDAIFQIYREYSLNRIYDFEHHVKIGEALEVSGRLPVTFMLLQPQSWSPEVWTDITRMVTLNTKQAQKGEEMHLCPMQFDLADRVIAQMSNPGDVVFDPFGGLMTVPYRAVLAGRVGVGCELNPKYFCDGVAYCRAAAEDVRTPSLFDVTAFDAKPAGENLQPTGTDA